MSCTASAATSGEPDGVVGAIRIGPNDRSRINMLLERHLGVARRLSGAC